MHVNTYLLTLVTFWTIFLTMLKKDAVKYYGNMAQVAKALRIHRTAVLRWDKWVPLGRALQLQQLSAGRLKCDMDYYMGRK